MFGSMLCVGSDVFVVPRHFVIRWEEIVEYNKTGNHRLCVYWNGSADGKSEIPWENVKVFYPEYKHLQDVAFIRLTKLVQMRHLAKFFVMASDDPVLMNTYLFGLRSNDYTPATISVQRAQLESNLVYKHEQRVDSLSGKALKTQVINLPGCYKYFNCFTGFGDCGLMLLHTDNSTNCRKALGMHIAGVEKYGHGYAIPIFQEDIEEGIQHFYPIETPIVLEEVELVSAQCLS